MKKLLLVIVNLIGLIFIFLEIKFLITGKYSTTFVDIFSKWNILISSILLILLILATTIIYLEKKPTKVFISIFLSITIILISTATLNKLDTSDFSIYQRDLGIQSVYICISENTNRYLLDYIYPMGKITLTGKYLNENGKLILDKDLQKELNLNNLDPRFKGNFINLKHFIQIE